MILVLSDWSVIQVIPLGLFNTRYTGAFFFLMGSPSTSTTSFSRTLLPLYASLPFMDTRPCSIYLSASLRLQNPVSLMYLFKLVSIWMEGRDWMEITEMKASTRLTKSCFINFVNMINLINRSSTCKEKLILKILMCLTFYTISSSCSSEQTSPAFVYLPSWACPPGRLHPSGGRQI